LRKFVGLFAVAFLAATLSLVLTSCRRSDTVSEDAEAVRICDEGTADLQAFRFQNAVDKLGHCLALDPSLAEAAISRALAYANLQDTDNARRELARADSLTAAMTDERRRMLAQLRLSQMRNSRYRAMGDSLRERMTRQEPDNFFVLEAEAAFAEHTGDSDAAIATWQRILEINPNHAGAYNKLGYLELQRGGYEPALKYLQKYIFLAPDLANPHDSYGEVLMTLGRYEEAEKEFRTSVRMQPDFYPSLVNLGRIYLARGQMTKGTAILGKVRQQIAGSAVERNVDMRILTCYLVTGQPDRLGEVSRKYVADYPKDPLTPLLRSLILANNGHREQGFAVMDSAVTARRAMTRYRTSEPARIATDLFAQQYEGLKQDLLGDAPAAVVAWTEAVALMIGNTPYYEQFFHRSRLAESLLAAGRAEAALSEIDAMLVVNPRLINVLVLKVQCHLDRSEKEAATEALDQLTWALSVADADYPPRNRSTDLGTQVNALAQR